MNLTIGFFTPKNVGINLNTINYLSLWPPKKIMKNNYFFKKICSATPNASGFLVAQPLLDVIQTSKRQPDVQGVAQLLIFQDKILRRRGKILRDLDWTKEQ